MESLVKNVTKQFFTAADGETYAIGRILGAILFAFSLMAPTVAALYITITTGVTWADLWSGLEKLSVYIPASMASVVALITLTNPTEPKVPAPTGGD